MAEPKLTMEDVYKRLGEIRARVRARTSPVERTGIVESMLERARGKRPQMPSPPKLPRLS